MLGQASRATAILLLALTLGCLAPGAAPPVADAPHATPPAEAGGEHANLWLLDGARPSVDASVSGGNEPMVLVDAQHKFVWIGDTAGLHRSADGGATWRDSPFPFVPFVFTDGWSLAQDADGVLYASTTDGPLIGVARSTDGGASWETTVSSKVVDASYIADRPWIAARGHGEVALVWNAGTFEGCSGSTDGAQTFLNRGLPGYMTANFGNLVVDGLGRYYGSNGATLDRFTVSCRGPYPLRLPPSGAQIFTQVAVDSADHQYVAQPSPDNARMEARGFAHMSTSGAKTLVVSDPVLRSNTFGAIAAHGGELAVAWYGTETPGDPTADGFPGAWNVYVARIQGFWTDAPTVTVTRLTTAPNHVGPFCMSGVTCTSNRALGDYMSVAYDDAGNLHVAYVADTAGVQVRYAYLPAQG